MYDTMVAVPDCSIFTDQNGYQINDCGKTIFSVVYHCLFQVFSTFAVLNVVIAIILGAFTWCYSLEPSEITGSLTITADNLRHFKAIWDRFDLFGTGEIRIEDLQTFLAVVRHNIPEIFATGTRDQQDRMMYKDCSSFGNGDIDPVTGSRTDRDNRERRCRENYNELVGQLGDFERSAELWQQLDMAGCDVWMGCNDNVAGFDIAVHPLGSTDANLHIFTKEVANGIIEVPMYTPGEEPACTEVVRVRFLALINVLVLEPLNLSEHDVYVCFDYKDPFSYFQPGYFGDKKLGSHGKVDLILDPNSIKTRPEADNPMLKPAFYKGNHPKIKAADLDGTFFMPEMDHDEADEIDAALVKDSFNPLIDSSNGSHHKPHMVAVVTKARGV